MKRDHAIALVAAANGAVIWFAVAALGGRREAWDSSLYWTVGMPAAIVAAALLAWFEPRKPWRWAVYTYLGQFVAMIVLAHGGGLWPLGLAAMLVLSLPAVAAAAIVGRIRNRKLAAPPGASEPS